MSDGTRAAARAGAPPAGAVSVGAPPDGGAPSPRAAGAPLLSARGVRVALGGEDVLRGVSLDLRPGELVAVVGPNGAGKSTLLRAVAGLLPPRDGEVRWAGRRAGALSPRELARLRAYLPQRPRVPPGLTVAATVAAGRAPHVGALRRPSAADRGAVERALTRAGVAALGERQLASLSGGELQRAFLALALAQEAPALLADEPTAHLDLGARIEVGRLLRSLADEGLAVACVLHDLDLACALADRLLVLAKGGVAAEGPPAVVVTPSLVSRVWGVEARVELGEDGPRVIPRALAPGRR